MRKKKRPGVPPNPVARALRSGGYTPRIVRNGKTYSRKIKHRKGSIENAPFLYVGTANGISAETRIFRLNLYNARRVSFSGAYQE